MNNFKVRHPRDDLQFEIDFTRAHRAAVARFTHPARIEAACLRAQFPAILHPIEDGDLLAGRIQMGLVGLGIQHQTGGFGFYINEEKVVHELEFKAGSAQYREDLHDLLTYWKGRNTNAIVLRGTPERIRGALFSDQWRHLPLPASPILRMAGAYVDFDKLIRIGVPGLEREVERFRAKAVAEGGDAILFESMLDVLGLLKDVCGHYRAQAAALAKESPDHDRRKQLERIAASLAAIPVRPPRSMHEGLQLAWIYGIMAPLIEYGRLDVYIGDLYAHDVDTGVLSQEEAVDLTRSFFRLIDHLDCETDGRVIVGGYGRRNPANADRMCLVAIEACRTLHEVLPQFTLRFNRETPREVWDAAMRCIEEGRTYPLLYNDDVLVPGVMKAFGVDRQRAESYVPLGCGEIEFDHYSFGTPSGSMNTLKILELAIRGGHEPMTDWHLAPELPPLAECGSYAEFETVYKKRLDHYIEAQAIFEKYEYEITGRMHPFMMVSMLYDGCLESGKAIFDGGCAYYGGTLELYGNVNAANSLAAIKRLVFEEKRISGPGARRGDGRELRRVRAPAEDADGRTQVRERRPVRGLDPRRPARLALPAHQRAGPEGRAGELPRGHHQQRAERHPGPLGGRHSRRPPGRHADGEREQPVSRYGHPGPDRDAQLDPQAPARHPRRAWSRTSASRGSPSPRRGRRSPGSSATTSTGERRTR